ncbi:flippase [Patescibacteria group bacterium]|nr:flippase [Patescibacteria group bacterium]MBU1448254.1 flippase [Patescibacteria group bacterium]MBU2613396.1 flippase [Patescibacteria group bacterium]
MSLTRVLALNTGVQFGGKIISTVLGVIIVGLITRQLGQEGFGMYSTANAFLQFFAIVLDLGLNVMVVQLLGEHAGDKAYEDRAVSATFTLRAISALVLLTLAPVIGLALPYPWELKLAFFAIWASFFTTALNQIVIGVQQRHLKMHVVAAGEILGRLVLLVGVIVARMMGWGLVPIVAIVSVGSTANFLLNILVARRYADFHWNVDVAFWKMLLGRSWPIGVSILFNLIYFKADTLILSFMRPQAEVGVYGAAYRVLEVLVTLPFMYAGILLPVIARSWATGDRGRFSRLLGHSFDAMMIFAAPLVAGTLVLATRGMVLVAGPDFAESGDVLRILILAVAAIFFGTISSYAIVALDAQRRMLKIYVVVALMTLVGYALFIPTYGLWAAAWLTVFSETCVAVASTVMTLRISGSRWMPVATLKAVAAAIVMAFIILPLKDMPLLIPVLAGITSYAALILATGAVPLATIREILSLRRTPPTLENPLS